MAKKILLHKTYITSFGTEFIPVTCAKGKIKISNRINPCADVGQREESRFVDADGNRIRKSKLLRIKPTKTE